MLHRCVMTFALVLAGCAGNGQGLDANGQPLQPGSGGPGPLTAEFDSIQAQVFTPICAVCHIGAGAPHGLRLDAADSYNLLVGVASEEVPGLLRVKPGDAADSYMVQKIEGHAAVGQRMPLGGPYLSADVIAVIRQWISDGASRAGTAAPAAFAVATAFAIVAVAPAPGEVLNEPPPQIMIGLNRELDVNRIDADSLRIDRLTARNGTIRTETVPAHVTVPGDNPRAILLRPERPLGPGHYLVVLRRDSGRGIADISGAMQGGAARPAGAPDDTLDRSITMFDVEVAP